MVAMKLGIVAKTQLAEAVELSRKVLEIAGEERVVLGPQISQALNATFRPEEFKSVGAVIAIGGDGTVLRAHRLVVEKPVIGINVGERGFLAEAEPAEVEAVVENLLKKRFEVLEAPKLAPTVKGRELPDAVNDIVVLPRKVGKTISLEVFIDKEFAFRFRGDGIVVATPTGSTGYARSAGGSILDPQTDTLTLVPICPSAPQAPKLVVPSRREIVVKAVRPGERGVVVVDGYQEAELGLDETVSIRKSKTVAKFVVWKKFYRKLEEKLL